MIITDKAQIKVASLKESDKLHLTTSDELECYELIESDLKLPADATFTRSSVAYLSDGTQVPANIPRFEQGKFGKAIMVEEGTTNLFTNPGWLDGTLTGWANYSNGNATGIRTVELDSKYGYRLKLERTGGQPSDRFGISQNKTWSASGSSLTISVYFKVVSAEEGAKLRIYTDLFNPSNTPYYGRGALVDLKTFKVTSVYSGKASVQALEDGWYYFTCTPSETDNSKGSIFFWIEGGNAQIYLAWSHVEAKPYATSFIDDTRSSEILTIPTTGVLNPQEGTVECWVYVPEFWKTGIPNWLRIWSIGASIGAGMYILRYDPARGNIIFAIYDNAGTAQNISVAKPSVGWRFFVARWSVAEMALFIDGIKVGSIVNPNLPSQFADSLFCIGHRPIYLTDQPNTLIDDFRISSRARTDEEILAAYQSGQPLPVDEWTTYKLDFDDKVRITTQGQIICNELIEI